jgi:class 3 adenylate cyclase/tetratricopeptide (TPR) repeat protein
VLCAACQADVPAGARFCPQCAAPQQPAACPSCGEPAVGAARFCASCGTPLAGLPAAAPVQRVPAVATERRVCSVLFCDLVGFTPLSEARDPEEVRELLSSYFDVARTIIGRYGGVVEKFIGDAVMAVWGTPTATEGDAERAIRAALDLIVAIGEMGRERGVPTLNARAGVVTGEVAVNLDAVGEGMVAGDAVNTAARVQSAASPGSVLVDDATHRVATGSISFASAGEHVLKGKAEPMTLWRVERVHSGVGGNRREDGLEAPLVGREAELRLIKDLFHSSIDRRTPRLVSVKAAAGLGKSRLGWEFEKYIDGLALVVTWHRGRCLSYGDGVAFWALAEMVRQRFDIAEEDPLDVAARKFTAGLELNVPNAADRAYIGPRLGRLLGVGPDESFSREELFAGWRLFFERLAADSPVVLLIEDLHHADAGLLDFLEHLLDWARDAPIFVLTLARPELDQLRPGWDSGRSTRTALTLDPLDDRAMAMLLDALVPGMPEEARQAIATQAQGIPLYAVETVRMLIDRDIVQPFEGQYRLVGSVGELTVPDTLQSLLAARLDSLGPDSRRVVADAAVLGGTFPPEALVAVSGLPEEVVRRVLDDLVRREVLAVRADPLSPQRGQYGFVQTMFRQVAYDTLSRRERKARHLAVAAHLRATFADDGEEVSEVVAQHLLDALDAVPNDDDVAELRQQATATLIRAGERAKRAGAPATAARLFARAADLHDDDDLDQALAAAALRERAGEYACITADYEFSIAQLGAAAASYRKYGRERDAARADTVASISTGVTGRFTDARALLEPAVDVLSVEPDADTVHALTQLSAIESFAGNLSLSGKTIQRAFDLAQELAIPTSPTRRSEMFAVLGIAQGTQNRLAQATANFRESLRIAREEQDALGIARALLNLSDIVNRTDSHAAAEIAKEAIDQCRLMGARSHLGTSVANYVGANMLIGDWDAAAAEIATALAHDQLESDPLFASSAIVLFALRGEDLGPYRALLDTLEDTATTEDAQAIGITNWAMTVVCSSRGDYEGALRHGLRATDQTDALGISHDAIRHVWPRASEAAVAIGDVAAARSLLELIEKRPLGHVTSDLRADYLRIRALLLAADRDSSAGEAFESAIAALRELGFPYHLAVGLHDHAVYLLASGDNAAGRVAAAEAADIAERLGARPLLDRTRKLVPVAADVD